MKPLPLWADKTCETCIFEVKGYCRHHINNYGYTPVVHQKLYRPACSFIQEGLPDEQSNRNKPRRNSKP